MKTRDCEICFVDHEIEISKKFYRAAKTFGTLEYSILADLYKQFPEFRIKVRVPMNAGNSWNPSYYDMKTIILSRVANPEEAMKEFDEICCFAKTMPSAYAYVRRWFMENYYSDTCDNYSVA